MTERFKIFLRPFLLSVIALIVVEIFVRWYWAQDFPTLHRTIQALGVYAIFALLGCLLGQAGRRIARKGEPEPWSWWGIATTVIGFVVALRFYWYFYERLAISALVGIGAFAAVAAVAWVAWRLLLKIGEDWLPSLAWMILAAFVAFVDFDRVSVAAAAGQTPTWEVALVSFIIGVALLGIWRLIQTRFRTKAGVAITLIALVTLAGFGYPHLKTPPPDPLSTSEVVPAQDAPQNALLIVVDTVPAKRFGCYGGVPTPAVDSLAAGGIRYENAYSTASWTRSSFASLLSGLLPSEHGCGLIPGPVQKDRVETPLSRVVDTLPERMAASFHTIGLVCNPQLTRGFGMDQGFETYHYYNLKTNPFCLIRFVKSVLRLETRYESGAWMVRHAIDEIRSVPRSERFFMMLHLMDPHDPYYPQKEYLPALRAQNPDAGEKLLNHMSEIQYADAQIGKLFQFLKDTGRWDDTLIIFSTDHGEEFGEHGGIEHGYTVYNESIRIPLLVHGPGIPAGKVIDTPISNRRIFNIIAQTFLRNGGPYDLLAGHYAEEKPVISEWVYHGQEQKASIDGMEKFIYHPVNMVEEYYDLVSDPLEQNNLVFDASDASLDRMLSYLEPSLERDAALSNVKAAQISDSVAAQLKALGYLGN